MAAAFAGVLICRWPFQQPSPAQIRVGHDSSDIPGFASSALKGGYDPYFHHVNFITDMVPSRTNAMARN
jgi:hypothetical protein